jgi:hypothetical protein
MWGRAGTATWKGGTALHTPLGTKHAKGEKGLRTWVKKLCKGGLTSGRALASGGFEFAYELE